MDCGYSCTEEKAIIQGVIDRTINFSKINPQWGQIMLGKFQEMIYEATMGLPTRFTVTWPANDKDLSKEFKAENAVI